MSAKFKYLFFSSVIGLALLLSIRIVTADQADTLVNVTNILPVASSVSIDAGASAVDLVENSTKTVSATFTVTDNNGCSDIDAHASLKTKAVFYRTNVTNGATCTPNDANCYTMICVKDAGTCTAGGADLTATYTCTAAVNYSADPTDAGSTYAATDWTANATPRDAVGSDGTAGSDTIEMNSLTAIDVTSSINYGSLALAANTGTADQTTVVTNTGSRQIDVQLDGYGATSNDGFAMVCTIGSIPIGNERYDVSAATAWSSKTQLSGTPVTLTTFNLAAAGTSNIYWGLGLPSTGVGGACSGKIDFTAVNG